MRPAGGSLDAGATDLARRAGPKRPAKIRKKKKNGKKPNRRLAAGGARPVVDGAGNTTVVFSAFNGEDNVVQTANRPRAAAFTGPDQVSESGEDVGLADIGVDAAGNAIATWPRNRGRGPHDPGRDQAARRGFAPLGDVSPPGGTAERPVLGVAPDGTATVVWRLTGISDSFLQSSTRPPGGAFSAPVSFTSGKDNPLFHEVARQRRGRRVVVWSGDNGANEIAGRRCVRRGRRFGPRSRSRRPAPTSSTRGRRWTRAATRPWSGCATTAPTSIVQWAGYDADPPQLGGVSIPGAATVGQTLEFSASAFDVWPVGQPELRLRRRRPRPTGTSVSHAYSAPGSYPVKVTAKDGAGRTATSTATMLVKARNYFTIGKLKRNRRKGTATLTVTIPEPGTIVVSGKGIKKATVRAAKAGTVKLPLKAAGKGLKHLKAKGRLKAKLRIAYSPVGGDRNAKPYKLALQKRLG